jgi:hypothetical protein
MLPSRRLPQAIVFGAIAGSMMGALVGEASFWLRGLDGNLAQGAWIGAILGSIGGVLIAIAERTIRGPFTRPDIATAIGIFYGLLPVLIGVIGIHSANASEPGGALIETLIGGPIVGLLIGALLDRAFEGICNKAWRKGIIVAVAGLSVSAAVAWGMVWKPLGPDPADLAQKTKNMIRRKWLENPELRHATIEKVTLIRETGMRYTGSFEATIDGQLERFRLTVIVSGQTIGATWEPSD